MIQVSGTVLFDQQKAEMTHLYYARKQSEDGPVLALLFSNIPLPVTLLDDRQKLSDLARRRTFVGLFVQLDESGGVQTTDLFYADGSFSGSWQFEAAAGNTNLRAGTIATDGERDFFGAPYAVNVNFILESKVDATWRGSSFYQVKPSGLKVGAAKGWMKRQGVETDLSHAVTFSEQDMFGDRSDRKLFLSAGPVTEELLANPNGVEQALHAAGVPFLRVGLDANDEIQTVMVPADDGNPMNFSSTKWQMELAAGSAQELDGRIELSDADANDDDFPRFAVSFHAATRVIVTGSAITAENGTALPADGGEPGRAYAAMADVLRNATSLEELAALRIPHLAEMVRGVPAEEREAVLAFLKQQGETPYRVVGGFTNKDQATLWLTGVSGEEKLEGRLNLHREAGTWKLGLEAIRFVPAPAL
jgi:hypothetical protein